MEEAFERKQPERADAECQDVEPEWKRQRRSRASVLPKQKMQADGDEEPRQYGLCCDACRGEGEDTRLLEPGEKGGGSRFSPTFSQ